MTNERASEDVKVPCEVYSRIVGYLRPIQNWNEGKQQEYQDRMVFNSSIGIDDEDKSTDEVQLLRAGAL